MGDRGRPTDYKEEYNELAYKFCLLGATDKQLASFFDVDERTITTWKKVNPDFLLSIKAGKEIADAEVASALYHRAKGFSHPEDKIFNNNGKPLIVPTTKHYPPDTAAAFIWLKNRAGWSDKSHIEHHGAVGIVDVEVTDEARKEFRKTLSGLFGDKLDDGG